MSTPGMINPFDDDIPSSPQPAPVYAPVVVQPASHAWLGYAAVIVVTVAITIVSTVWLIGGRKEPLTPSSTLTIAARSYIETIPSAYDNASDLVLTGRVKTKAELVDALKAHAKPLAEAQDAAIKARSNDKGEITDASGLASDLKSVAVGLAKGSK